VKKKYRMIWKNNLNLLNLKRKGNGIRLTILVVGNIFLRLEVSNDGKEKKG